MLPWLPTVITAIVSILASSGFWAFVQHRAENKSARTRLLVGLAHDRILQSGTYYLNRKWISMDEFENIHDYLYLPYKELGGNGTAERVVQMLKELPHNPPAES